jgi:hypothetical protein
MLVRRESISKYIPDKRIKASAAWLFYEQGVNSRIRPVQLRHEEEYLASKQHERYFPLPHALLRPTYESRVSA